VPIEVTYRQLLASEHITYETILLEIELKGYNNILKKLLPKTSFDVSNL